jgi:hypothetical protein
MKNQTYLVTVQNNCFLDVYFNLIHLSHIKLHIVVGSLGIGCGNTPFYEYGGIGSEWDDIKKISPIDKFDCHVWLEDDEGNIYDAIRQNFLFVAKFWSKQITFKTPVSIIKQSKESLKKRGLHYVAFSINTQNQVIQKYRQLYQLTDDIIKELYIEFCSNK